MDLGSLCLLELAQRLNYLVICISGLSPCPLNVTVLLSLLMLGYTNHEYVKLNTLYYNNAMMNTKSNAFMFIDRRLTFHSFTIKMWESIWPKMVVFLFRRTISSQLQLDWKRQPMQTNAHLSNTLEYIPEKQPDLPCVEYAALKSTIMQIFHKSSGSCDVSCRQVINYSPTSEDGRTFWPSMLVTNSQ